MSDHRDEKLESLLRGRRGEAVKSRSGDANQSQSANCAANSEYFFVAVAASVVRRVSFAEARLRARHRPGFGHGAGLQYESGQFDDSRCQLHHDAEHDRRR